jgi:DNA-binding transcriptional MocR family regulator
VGFAACRQDIADELTDIKMLTSITSSQFAERLLYGMLLDGHYRKYLARLRERLDEARVGVIRAFDRIGLEVFAEPAAGMFLWARFADWPDSLALAEQNLGDGLVLAPGSVFRPHLDPTPFMRFNVAICQEPHVLRRLERIGRKAK